MTRRRGGVVLVVLGAAVLGAGALGVAVGQEEGQEVLHAREHMTDAEWRATGVQRLSDEERAALDAWLTRFAAAVRRGDVADPNPPAAAAETLERVNLDPGKYLGRTLVFEGCQVERDVKNVRLASGETRHALSVRSAAGAVFPTAGALSGTTLNVLVGARLAGALTDLDLGEARFYPARLTCAIEALEDGGSTWWVARVTRVDVCTREGRVLRTLSE